MIELKYPLHAIRSDGHVHHVTDEEAARRLGRDFGLRHVEQGISYHDIPHLTFGARRNEWIVRDDWGTIVAPSDLPDRPRRRPWWMRGIEQARHAAANDLPIPGTGRKVRGRHRRRIKQGLKALADAASTSSDIAEIGLAGHRFARVGERVDARCLPHRSEERCWKAQRRTRWK